MALQLIYGNITKITSNGHFNRKQPKPEGAQETKSFIIKPSQPEFPEISIKLPPDSFCPAAVGDVVYGYYITIGQSPIAAIGGGQTMSGITIGQSPIAAIGGGQVEHQFFQLPVVEIPMVEENVRKTIMLALYGTNYTRYLIDRIYDFFKEETIRRLQTNINVARVAGNSDVEIAETITVFVEGARFDKEGAINNLVQIGLSPAQAEKIMSWWRSKYTLRRLYLLGLTKKEIKECSERGWDQSSLYRQLTINPFIVEKVPYEKALQIVQRYFLQLPQEYAECARIVRFVDGECEGKGDFDKGKGWTCYPMYMLSRTFPNLLSLQTCLKDVFRCSIRYNFLYLHHQAEAEDILTKTFVAQKLPPTSINPETVRKLSNEQAMAVDIALNYNISIITGPGGTGKTTTLAQFCEELEFRGISYLVTAFTGKAVARIKQVLKRPGNAMTLHMVLSRYKSDEKVQCLIVDESSQVDNWLIAAVLKKINNESLRIVMFGDPRQLQPFNGDFFNQLISSEKIPHIELTEDRRRRKNTGCLFKNMKALAEERPQDFEWGEDCHFSEGDIPEVLSIVTELAQTESGRDITVICPYNNLNDELNNYIQNIFVSSSSSIRDSFGKIWKVGARVMMLVNRHDIGIMNGEEGEIIGVNLATASIKVHFDNHEPVDIPTYLPVIIGDLDPDLMEQPLSTKIISLSWSVTPDKGQGSQWEKTICYFPFRNRGTGFLHKKRGYTAVSRASGELFIVSDSETAVRQMFATEPAVRYDNLSNRLKGIPYKNEYIDPVLLSQMTA